MGTFVTFQLNDDQICVLVHAQQVNSAIRSVPVTELFRDNFRLHSGSDGFNVCAHCSLNIGSFSQTKISEGAERNRLQAIACYFKQCHTETL